jgi:hypothetical protein
MLPLPRRRNFIACLATAIAATLGLLVPARSGAHDVKTAPAIEQGQRVFSAGHSFHVFMPNILRDIAKGAGIKDHVQVGLSSIGGSRVIQHWDVPEDKFKAKESLRAGKVDVLTLSPIFLPDDGIENFVKLAVENNPKVRVTIQEFWMPFDSDSMNFPPKDRPKEVERNSRTGEALRKMHAAYFKSMDGLVRDLNNKYGKQTVFVVPVGQAVIALRERIIAGTAPGLKMQDELFTDAVGHVRAPVQALNAYCHFAVIYRRSPVGLPMPAVMAKSNNPNWNAELNRVLQEIAWDAVRNHPLSGVKSD